MIAASARSSAANNAASATDGEKPDFDESSLEEILKSFNNRINGFWVPSSTPQKTVDLIKRSEVNRLYAGESNLLRLLRHEELAVHRAHQALAASVRSVDNSRTCHLSEVPWTQPTEEQLECIYLEGVSMTLQKPLYLKSSRYGASKNQPESVLVVRFHPRQLQCLGTNQFWYMERLFSDMVGLRVETNAENGRVFWASTLQDQQTRPVPWGDIGFYHHVPQRHIKSALDYVAEARPGVVSEEFREKTPATLAVEFQIEDSLVGVVDTEQEYLGAGHIFRYGKNGKDRTAAVKALSSPLAELGAPEAYEPATDRAAVPVLNVQDWLSLLSEQRGCGGAASRSRDEKESVYSWSDVIEFHTSSKSGDADELMRQLLGLMDDLCETLDLPDEGLYDGRLVRDGDFVGAMNRFASMRRLFVTANPAVSYRLVSHVFCTCLMLRLRCPLKQTVMCSDLGANAGGGNQGFTVSVKLGRNMVLQANDNVHAKFRSTKDKCCCRLLCSNKNWLDELRDQGMIERQNLDLSTVASTAFREHPAHRYMPMNLNWLDEYACSRPGKFVGEHDPMAGDTKACDMRTRCYQASQGHYLFCPNKMVCSRGPGFKHSLEHSALSVYNGDNLASSQRCDMDKARDTLVSSVPLKGTEHLAKAKESGTSLRDFAARLATCASSLALVDSNLSNSTCGEAIRKVRESVHLFSDLIGTVEDFFGPGVFEETQEQAAARRAFVDWLDRPDGVTERTRETLLRTVKSCVQLAVTVAKYRLRSNNAAFCTGINYKQGIYAIRYSVVGARMKLVAANKDKMTAGNKAEFHQVLAAVDASVVFGDHPGTSGDGNALSDIATQLEMFGGKRKRGATVDDEDLGVVLKMSKGAIGYD